MDSPPAPPPNESTAEAIKGTTENMPAFMRAINSELLPNNLAQFGAASVISPAYANLQADIYRNVAPYLAHSGNIVSDITSRGQAARDTELLRGAGGNLLKEYLQAQQMLDPEYYGTRAKLGGVLNEKLGNALSGAERSEIERSLNRQNVASGNNNTQSNLDVVRNAMTAGREGRSALDNTIQQALGFLSTGSRTGADAFQIATGRPSGANPGNAQFLGAQKADNTAAGAANSILGSATQFGMQANQINSERESGFDKALGFTSGVMSNISL